MATNEHTASFCNRDLQNNKRPPGYTLGYVLTTWDQRFHMVASGTAVDLMTLAWIKTPRCACKDGDKCKKDRDHEFQSSHGFVMPLSQYMES